MGILGIEGIFRIRPTQNYLFSETIEFYQNNPQISLPIPIGKEIIYDNYDYFIIDGHHNICHHIFSKQRPLFWVAEHNQDYIPLEIFPKGYEKYIRSCNEEIKIRYHFAQINIPKNEFGEEVKTLADLLKEIKSKKE